MNNHDLDALVEKIESRDRQIEFMQSTLVQLMGQMGSLTQALQTSQQKQLPTATTEPDITVPRSISVDPTLINSTTITSLPPTIRGATKKKERSPSQHYQRTSRIPKPAPTRTNKNRSSVAATTSFNTKSTMRSSSSLPTLVQPQNASDVEDDDEQTTFLSSSSSTSSFRKNQKSIAATKQKYENAWVPRVARLGEMYKAAPLHKKDEESSSKSSAAAATNSVPRKKRKKQWNKKSTPTTTTRAAQFAAAASP